MLDAKHSLFQEFQPVTKAEWHTLIERDLKGKSISDLMQTISSITISPFAHIEDFEGVLPYPIVENKNSNKWLIGETITVQRDIKKSNTQALKALMGGVNCLFFECDNVLNINDIEILLKDIELSYIETYFNFKCDVGRGDAIIFIRNLVLIIQKRETNPEILRGGITLPKSIVTKKILIQIKNLLPLFKCITIDSTAFYKGSDNVIEELVEAILEGKKCIKLLIDKDLDIDNNVYNFKFDIVIGLNYFIEISKIRALKLLWGNVLKAYNIPPSVPIIHANIFKENISGNTHLHKIKVTTQAMSAIIGGVSSLTIVPDEDDEFGRHISRNVQHLLQLESYMDRVQDPAAGSYYIEQLTTRIAEKVWAIFQEKI